ncbi:MAG: NADH-quinone oxidoreductase subunit H [Planctomycetota bacterium]|nr:NADH-quinone oxidoreductase subunit H [Planctomycetota bacterium]
MPLELLGKLAVILLVFGSPMVLMPLLVFLERKVCAFIQDRIGPNRVGLLGPDGLDEALLGKPVLGRRLLGGFLQPMADGIKLLFKEDIIPENAKPVPYVLAPVFAMVPPLLVFAVIPFAPPVKLFGTEVPIQVADPGIGVLFVLAVLALSPFGTIMGGWGSGSKYPLLGCLRAVAQVVSYGVCMGLAMLAVLMTAGTLRVSDIVAAQSGGVGDWFIWSQPVAFLLFLVCAFAENNRLPFDMPECEPELVGGYHTEYSSMKFAMFFLGEYIAMIAASAVTATLFLGGWSFPGIKPDGSLLMTVLSFAVFWVKVSALLFLYLWVRWTLPRFRFDQIMRLGWAVMIPAGLVNLAVTAVIVTAR